LTGEGEPIVLKKYSRPFFLILIGLLAVLLLLSAPAAHGASIDPAPVFDNQAHTYNWP
jgi:hypothetical protein